MFKGLEYVKETIDLRLNDIKNNRFETNILLFDDILKALGYDKRKEKGVRAVSNDEIDWEISVDGEYRFIVTVYGFGLLKDSNNLHISELDSLNNRKNRFDFYIRCDGKALAIFNEKEKIAYIDDIFSDEAEHILKLLSKSDYNKSKLESFYTDTKLTREKVLEMIDKYSVDIARNLCAKLNIESIKTIESLSDTIREISKGQIISTNDLKSNQDNEDNDEHYISEFKKREAEYQKQIAELIKKNEALLVDIKNANAKMHDFEKSTSGMEQVNLCKQLLDAIENNPELPRTYVGVINGKLFQISELEKFMGTAIQELYSIVGFDLMHILFDGEVIKLIQPSVRDDMVINSKTYDIDLYGMSEEQALFKLSSVFSSFNDRVIFLYKCIGSVNNNEDTEDYLDFGDTDKEYEKSIEDESSESSTAEVDENPYLMALCIKDIANVLWADDNPIRGIKGISNNSNLFKIDDSSLESLINDSVVALLALKNSNLDAISKIKDINFEEVSAFIHSKKIDDNDFRLLNTNYFVNLQNMQQAIMLIVSLSETFEIDTESVFIYFDAYYTDGSSYSSNFVNKEDYDLTTTYSSFEKIDQNEEVHCLLAGSSYNRLKDIPDISKFENELFTDTVAVRGKDYQFSIRTNEEIAEAIVNLAAKFDSESLHKFIGNVNAQLDVKTIFTNDDLDIPNDVIEASIEGLTLYIRNQTCKETIDILTTLNREIYDNDTIDLRIKLDDRIYNCINERVYTCDPHEYLAYSLIRDEIFSRTKIIQR